MMSDKNRIERLEQRIDQLEEQLDDVQTPSVSRRTALGALGLAGLGTAGGSMLATRASAQEGSGSIGTAENPLEEIHVDELYQNANHITADSVSAESLVDNRHFAGAFDGADADARLDNALSAASAGDKILLENANYSSRTISKSVEIVGFGTDFNRPTLASGEIWTCDARVAIKEMDLGGDEAEIIFNQGLSRFHNGAFSIEGGESHLTINADNCILTGLHNANVEFASDSSGGLLDSSRGVSVTDPNDNNTEGDNA